MSALTVHFDAVIGATPFPTCKANIRVTTDAEGSLDLRGSAALCVYTGAASVQMYVSSAELRRMAAAFVQAADRTDHAERLTTGEAA